MTPKINAPEETLEQIKNSGLIEEVENWNETFIGCFLRKYPKYYRILNTIRDIVGENPRWEHFTRSNIREIVTYYRDACAQSTARTYMAMIRGVLNDEPEKVPCSKFADELKVANVPAINIYINMKEIELIANYQPINEREEVVRAQFLISCYTGARHSDAMVMSPLDIVDGKLSYVSQKTKKYTQVEAKNGLADLIEQGKKRMYCVAIFNETIREIARKAGINGNVRVFRAGKYQDGEKWQYISSHTARRSFATNLCLLGVPIRDISLRMGHSNTIMTERYIVAKQSDLSNKALAFFK